MKTVLVTGASGFLGRHLTAHLAEKYRVIGISRKAVNDYPGEFIRGDYGSFEDLRKLDAHVIDALVHMGGETGGTSEEAGLNANVMGSRRLMRYLSDRGCRRFILASSIAATGCLHPQFTPLHLPIRPDHDCLAQDAYGLSKAMLEQLAGYFGRTVAGAEFTCLRFGWVMYSSRTEMPWCDSSQAIPLPFLYLGQVATQDILGAISAVLKSQVRPGGRVYNLVGPDVRSQENVAGFIRAALGERMAYLDASALDAKGHECAPVYDMHPMFNDFGFRPTHKVCTAQAPTLTRRQI